jgi:transcriptional regulator with XRE-family HTH domain
LPKPPEYRTLGLALRALRQAASLTQVEAGKSAGIRSNFVAQVERGERGLTWSTLLRLLSTYDADLRDLADEIDQTSGKRPSAG